jgi:hypothetical protein
MAVWGKFYNAYLYINGASDISTKLKSVQLNYTAAMLDASAMGVDTKVNMAGIKEWSLTCEGVDGVGAGELDTVLFPLVGAAPFAIVFRPDQGARGAGNPEFTGQAVLSGSPMGGAHGALLSKQFTFQCAGALGRSVAA